MIFYADSWSYIINVKFLVITTMQKYTYFLDMDYTCNW